MDAFGLVERGLFGQAIIEQRGAGRLVPRDPGGDVEVAAVSQLLGDPRAVEAVGADLGGEARLLGATLDHLERTEAQQHPILERIVPPGLAASEQRAAAVVFADAGALEVGVDMGLGGVVGGDHVVAPALLVEAEEPAGPWV